MTDKSIPYSVITTKFGSVSCSRRLVNGKPVYRVDSMILFGAAEGNPMFGDYSIRGNKTVDQCEKEEYPYDAVCTLQHEFESFDLMWTQFMEVGEDMLNLQMKQIKTEYML